MERSAWTDERLNDLAATLDTNVKLLHEEIGALRQEMHDGFRELRGEIGGLRADLSAWQRQIAQIGWALATALIMAVVALIVAAL